MSCAFLSYTPKVVILDSPKVKRDRGKVHARIVAKRPRADVLDAHGVAQREVCAHECVHRDVPTPRYLA
jgi:hypothetical protein